MGCCWKLRSEGMDMDGSYMWFGVLFAERFSYLSKFDLSKASGLL